MTEYVRDELGREDHERGPLEKMSPRRFTPHDYAQIAYKPDMYVIEPAVLDDLEEAKAQEKKDGGARLEKIRHHWRAMSWWSHGPTNTDVASKLSEAFLHEAQKIAAGEGSHEKQQTGFEFSNQDVAEWARVLNTLKEINCKGSMVAKPTDFIEKKITEAWIDLIKEFKDRKNKSEWPTTHDVVNPPKLSERVQKLSTRLTNLRNIHDMLSYQLLYPKHCMYAQLSKAK
jgi:hypothetical protein